MVEVATLAVQVDTTDLQDAKAEMDKFTASGERAEAQSAKLSKSNNKLAASTKSATDAARRGRIGWRQIGLQFNQVSQQTAVTGNFMQALSIQLPDILLGFGSLGIAAGIAAPAIVGLGAAMLSTSGDSEELAENLDDLSAGIDAFKRASLEGAELADYLAEQFGAVSTEALELAERIQDLRMTEILINAANAVDNLTGAFQGGLRSELARLVNFFDEFEYTGEQSAVAAKRFADGLELIRTATGPQEQLDAVTDLAGMLLDAAGNVDNMTAEQREYYSLLLQTAQRLSLVATLTQDVANNTGDAADNAGRLSDNLIAAFNAKSRLDAGLGEGGGVQGGRGNVVPGATDALLASLGGEFIESDEKGKKGGADQFESRLERLQKQLMTEREIVDEWYFEGLEILADRRSEELLTQAQHLAAKMALEEEYNYRVGELQRDQARHTRDAQKNATNEAIGFLSVLAQRSKGAAVALLAVNTGLRISEAIQNTAVAATRALAELGPIAGPPAAASIKAYGAVQVGLIAANAALRLGSSGGGGGGGSSSGLSGGGVPSSGPATLEEPQVSRNVAIQLTGGPSFDRSQVRDLINQINDAVEDGAIIRLV